MKKSIAPRILLIIAIVLLACNVGFLIYVYHINIYSPYASAGLDVDALIFSVLFLPPIAACLISSHILHLLAKKKPGA